MGVVELMHLPTGLIKRGRSGAMISYSELFTFEIMICTVITLVIIRKE